LQTLDEDGDGFIPVHQMRDFLTSLGEVFSPQEAE
jgi:Ca2+-binding EF-hand superfamily protein